MSAYVTVHVRRSLTSDDVEEIGSWLAGFTEPEEPTTGCWRFRVVAPERIGLPVSCARTCLCEVQVTPYAKMRSEEGDDWVDSMDAWEITDIERLLGYRPAHDLNVWVDCDGVNAQHVLGRLALALAERYGGVINIGFALTPPTPRRYRDDGIDIPHHSQEEISVFVHGFPGTVWEQYYTDDAGRRWVSHIVDAEFFRAWLAHPRFHLVPHFDLLAGE